MAVGPSWISGLVAATVTMVVIILAWASSSKEASRQFVAFAASTTARHRSIATRGMRPPAAFLLPGSRRPLRPASPPPQLLLPPLQQSRLLAADGHQGEAGASSKAKKGKKDKGGGKGGGAGEEAFRLDRLLSNRGVGSRTEVTALVRRGRVKLAATGEVVKDPAARVPASAVLLVNDEAVAPLPILVAYHKPLGVHSAMGDPMGRPNLEDALPARLSKQFHPVGRLDADTTGLLLFASDGQLTQRLLHPSSQVQREYQATVEGEVDEASLRAKLAAGVETADGTYEADLLGVDPPSTVRVGVAEGKHRMVRRMLANAGHGVLTLHRYKYGRVELGDLPEGEVREIAEDCEEGQWARRLLKGKGS